MKQIQKWNRAVGKLVWHIGANKDDFWVKWVHNVYIKNHNWWDYKTPSGASWIMKYLCKVKDTMKNYAIPSWNEQHRYQISQMYKMLTGDDHLLATWAKRV